MTLTAARGPDTTATERIGTHRDAKLYSLCQGDGEHLCRAPPEFHVFLLLVDGEPADAALFKEGNVILSGESGEETYRADDAGEEVVVPGGDLTAQAH